MIKHYKNNSLCDIIYIDNEGVRKVEKWANIINYDRYLISDLGRIKRIGGNRSVDKIIKQNPQKTGYLMYTFYNNGIKTSLRIHRLVGISFISNPLNKPCINHKNGIKTDNRIQNLEWCTVSENTIHSFRVLGQKPSKTGSGKFNEQHAQSKRIICENNGKIYPSIQEAVRKLKLQQACITRICQGTQTHTKGLVFKYL